jgi:hypothetical protein
MSEMSENVADSENPAANPQPFKWNNRRELAALLVADDHLSNTEIGLRCGVTDRQVERWKEHSEFQARVEQHVDLYRSKIQAEGLALKEKRLELVKSRLAAIRGIVRARGRMLQGAPGNTDVQRGLQVLNKKAIGSGLLTQFVDEYAVDTGLLAEERALLQYLAIEMGDWKTKVQLDTDVDIVERLQNARKRAAEAAEAQS